mmetsp:Transcript_3825/g.3953  ORF Transcript_3825/g.3953 Transcript_3825/m.3953 type:complete len:536 (-) Transcript_3825:165-1772(-)
MDDEHCEENDCFQSLKGMGTDINNSLHDENSITNAVLICVLYASLPPEQQLLAFEPKPNNVERKVILATNIAETSVTLSGIRYVVDAGKVKIRDFCASTNDNGGGVTGMESLIVSNISKAQASQRSGRAGRVQSGYCFRLYPEIAYDALPNLSTPEILRVNLAQVVLQLKGMGINDARKFDFLTPPTSHRLLKALELLYALGAVDANDEEMKLTAHGKCMARLPLDPVYSHLLLQSRKYDCVSDIVTTVAMLSAENVFYRPGGGKQTEEEGDTQMSSVAAKAFAAHKRFASYEGDLPTLLSIYNAWEREAIYVPPNAGGRKAELKRLKQEQRYQQQEMKKQDMMQNANSRMKKRDGGKMNRILHGEWCRRNFISGRALVKAYNVRDQLSDILSRDLHNHGMGWGDDVTKSCETADRELYLKCICAGLFLQCASRVDNEVNTNGKGRNGSISSIQRRRSHNKNIGVGGQNVMGRYETKVGRANVSVHPTSTMFGRNPAPKCVVYTELLVTKKTYIRGVTQVKECWLADVAPNFFKS